MTEANAVAGSVVQAASSRSAVALCFAVAVLEGFDIQALGVAAPQLVPALGLTPSEMGWVFSISNFGLVVGALAGGRFGDHFGRKRVLVASVVAFAIMTLALAFARSFEELFVARLLAGLGFGASFPILMALGTELSPPGKRTQTATAMFCGMPLGGACVALLTQLLPAGYDWRVLFLIGGVLPLLVAIALQLRMTETLATGPEHASRAMPISEALFGEGRALRSVLLWIAFLPTLLILYLILNWLPLLVAAKGFDRAVAPQSSLVFNVASVVGALVIGRLVDRFGARWPLVGCYAVLLATLWALSGAQGIGTVLALSAITGFVLLGANFSLYGIAPAHYPALGRGTGSGVAMGFGRVGSVMGPLLAGMLLGGGTSAAGVILFMVPAAAIAGAAVFMLGVLPARH